MRVLVTGATGLIGRRLVPRLVGAGRRVTVLVRDAARMGVAADRVAVRVGCVEDPEAVARAVDGCEAVIHLANASGEADAARVGVVNVDGTRNLLDSSRAAGVGRFVFTSSVAATRERLGAYGRTKRRAEELVRDSGVPFVVVRPSLVYGDPSAGLAAVLARVVRSLPIVPVIGDGRVEIDPVHVDDVCAVLDACLASDHVLGKTYDLLGPERVTFDGLLQRLAQALGVRRPLVHVPAPLALAGARVLGMAMARPPLTADQVIGLTTPARVDREAALRDFRVAWTPLDEGLRRLVEGAIA